MKKTLSAVFASALTLCLAMATASCDQVERVASGVGGSKSSTSSTAAEETVTGDDASVNADSADDTVSDDGSQSFNDLIEVAQAETQRELQTIRLSAFRDFNCSSEWTERDGGWGLRAGSGSGTCTVSFPGGSGSYRVTLMAQLEFDGNPNFRIEVDDTLIAAGSYPMSMGELICDCPNWRVNCPDRIVPIDAGVHDIREGASILFAAAEVYPCGGRHGAYAKWHELVFSPQE